MSSEIGSQWPSRSTPPIALVGYSYTYRTYVFQVSQGIALYPPPPKKKHLPLSQPRGGGWQGVSQLKLHSGGIALYRGIAEIVSPIAV